MQRSIIGYCQDDAGDWKAELDCGHFQHIRHQPPFILRPWSTTPEGRESRLGQTLHCVLCDEGAFPPSFETYKQTPIFDQNTIPKGLLRAHSTKKGVWAKIVILEGSLLYTIEGPPPQSTTLTPTAHGVVVAEVEHHVASEGPVRFYVAFYKKPSAPEQSPHKTT